jgi:hypothetical protein
VKCEIVIRVTVLDDRAAGAALYLGYGIGTPSSGLGAPRQALTENFAYPTERVHRFCVGWRNEAVRIDRE